MQRLAQQHMCARKCLSEEECGRDRARERNTDRGDSGERERGAGAVVSARVILFNICPGKILLVHRSRRFEPKKLGNNVTDMLQPDVNGVETTKLAAHAERERERRACARGQGCGSKGSAWGKLQSSR